MKYELTISLTRIGIINSLRAYDEVEKQHCQREIKAPKLNKLAKNGKKPMTNGSETQK